MDKTKPTIMITGAAGALAQQVIQRLRENANIVAVDFREQVYLGDEIPSYCIDFNKRGFEDLFRKYNFTGVIHLGRIMSSQETRMRRYNANVLGAQKLFEFCHKYEVKQVLVLSTYHVYGAMPYNPALIDEQAPLKAAELTMDLIDSVELENLSTIYLWKYPDLNITILRACNIVGPEVRNTISKILGSEYAPTLLGFSPIMQFIHIDDMADAIVLAFQTIKPGIYNVAPDDWVSYQDALLRSGCKRVQIPSIPPVLPKMIIKTFNLKKFPTYLVNYFKYPVVIDGRLFNKTYNFRPQKSLSDIFNYYKERKLMQGKGEY